MTTDSFVSPGEVGGPVATAIRARLEPYRQRVDMAKLLLRLVRVESPSDDVAGLNEMADVLVALFGEFGRIQRLPLGQGGASHLSLDIPGPSGGPLPHLVVLGHYDTVHPRGTIDRLPAVVDSGVLTGPGCFDMKGGLAILYYALRELRELGLTPRRAVRILINCDEEIRSHTSRGLIEDVAKGAEAAFVLESPLPGGGLKTARKGAGIYRLEITGLAAHAGIEPEKGASAITELANQVRAIAAMGDRDKGTTVNVGLCAGGTRANVVAASAFAEIDVRFATASEAARIERSLAKVRPVLPGTAVKVVPGLSTPPMEPTDASRLLFTRARATAEAMGVDDLYGGATGGASDANHVSAMDIPTIDGLGPEGGGAHADNEHVLVDSLPRRVALLAGLLAEV